MKRLAIYLAVTFGLTWGLQIPAGISMGAFQNGLESSATMVAVVGLSMFFPLVGALAAYFAFPPKERIDLCWKPLIRENVFQYLAAWFLPAAIAIAGCAVFFLANPQQAVSKETLITKVWGYDSSAEDNNVEAYISFLRKKLAFLDSRVKIVTLRQIGYKLDEAPEAEHAR